MTIAHVQNKLEAGQVPPNLVREYVERLSVTDGLPSATFREMRDIVGELKESGTK